MLFVFVRPIDRLCNIVDTYQFKSTHSEQRCVWKIMATFYNSNMLTLFQL
jgi:hypothetical protein